MSQETQAAILHDCREAFADTLIALARDDERIVAVCNDSVGSSNLAKFKAEFPDRMINVGIAEQDLVGVAAGLANGGLIPFTPPRRAAGPRPIPGGATCASPGSRYPTSRLPGRLSSPAGPCS